MEYYDLKSLQNQWTGIVCLFGCGEIGSTWAYDLLMAMGFHINCYCDNNKEENIEIKNGIKTISLETLYSFKDEVLVFITVGDKHHNGIRNQLERNGIHNIIETGFFFLQTFIESLLEINDKELCKQFNCILDDAEYIRKKFEYRMGYSFNMDSPKTFNEKIQWLKLFDRNPDYVQMVDKYEVKRYVADKIGPEYIIPTLGLYDTFDEIEFEKFPRKFVLKCTHDSGGIFLCKDKSCFDRDRAKFFLENRLKRNYYWACREWPYKDVKPRIIAEEYMCDDLNDELIDYKFMCFNGEPKMIFTCSERFEGGGLKVTFFDLAWNKMDFERHYPSSYKKIEKPQNLELMIKLAKRLSNGILFVRVDFYEIRGQVYFGEMTFFPGSGMEEFSPIEWDYTLGEWIRL